MGKIIHVKLLETNDHVVKYYNYSDTFLRFFIGGRGFNMRLLTWMSNYPPKNYYDKSNAIFISPGLLAGTEFPSSGRTSIAVLKSPITGFWGEGNFGGYFGPALKLCGVDTLVISGRASQPTSIHIKRDSSVHFMDCSGIWRYGTIATTAILEKLNNPREEPRKVLCIGSAGANKIFSSVVLCDNRTSGGGGSGAVFGSKNLKAVVVDDNLDEAISGYSPESMRILKHVVEEKIKAHPVFNTFSTYGTTSLVEIHSGLKYFPTKNWLQKTWSKWTNISGKTLLEDFKEENPNFETDEELAIERRELGCINCPITCSNAEKIEYETLNCLGSKLGIDRLEWIRQVNHDYFNDAGLDVIQTTSIISAIMEMTEEGLILGSDLTFGNEDAVVNFLSELQEPPDKIDKRSLSYAFKDGFKTGIFRLLMQGDIPYYGEDDPAEVAQRYEDSYFPNVKGMGLSGVFPSEKNRASALAIATSSRGADHLRSLPTLATYADWYLGGGVGRFKKILKLFTIPIRSLLMMKGDTKNLTGDLYDTYKTTFGVPSPVVDGWKKAGFLLDPKVTKGWGSMIKFCQEVYAVSDSFGTCRFISPWRFGIGPETMAEAFSHHTGLKVSWEELLKVGERIYAMEKYFSTKYGIPIKDSIPKRFLGDADGKLRESTFSAMKEDYYNTCGYDSDGIPTIGTMARTGIGTLEEGDLKMLNTIDQERVTY